MLTGKGIQRYSCTNMAEVFSISGAGSEPTCPAGWAPTPNGNCGASVAGCAPNMRVGNSCRSPLALALQNALVSLGRAVNDPQLKALKIDGFIGPATQKAVNQAFTTHIGAGQATPDLRTGKILLEQVAENAKTLTQILATEVQRRGAKVLPLQMQALPTSVPTAQVKADAMRIPAMPSNALWGLVGLMGLSAGVGYHLLRKQEGKAPSRRKQTPGVYAVA